MNYLKIHNDFIKYCYNTSIEERLFTRNKKDERLNKDYIYSEVHHIIPKHNGGTDNRKNLVRLLPEEHLFIHKLLYKIYDNRKDMLSVRFIINGLNNMSEVNRKKSAESLRLSKEILKSVAFIKQNSADFRKRHGWQTKDGRNRIAMSKKNKVVVKDSLTNEMIGMVSTNHPKYISGEWVHHSKGKVPVTDRFTNEKLYIDSQKYQSNKDVYIRRGKEHNGSNNPRWIDISEEEIYNLFKEFSIMNGFIISIEHCSKYFNQIKNIKIPTKRLDKMSLYEKVHNETKLPLLIRTISKENKEKFLKGYNNVGEFMSNEFNIDYSVKTINYPKSIKREKND